MGLDYLMVHVKYNLPPALLLTILYKPFFTRLEVHKIVLLCTIAVVWTIPWDSYLIRTRIWSYPADSVLGQTLFQIPLEEVFFFIIQTYNTSLLYIIFNKRLVLPSYLSGPTKPLAQGLFGPITHRTQRDLGTLFFTGILILGISFIYIGGEYMYLGLILSWVSPILVMQWVLMYRFLLALPPASVWVPIALPTLYLWVVDTLALRRGTWVIESGTKVDIQLWEGLEIEEALFFLVTNVMVVFGIAAMHNAAALFEYKAFISTTAMGDTPSIYQLITLFLTSSRLYDTNVLQEMSQAVTLLKQKSQSMYLGSAMFEGQLRLDLIALYSFCRKADDLIDDAPDRETAKYWIEQCEKALELRFKLKETALDDTEAYQLLTKSIPQPLHAAAHLLPASRLPKEPLSCLLQGFEIDLKFDFEKGSFPIATEHDLEVYAYHVAGTVASLLLELVFRHHPVSISEAERLRVISAGEVMGRALQYTNIARDITRDAEIGRVYIPSSWLAEEGLTPSMVISHPRNSKLIPLRRRILEKADKCYCETQEAISKLPSNVQGPVRATVTAYMEIGQVIRENETKIWNGKLKVSRWRRFKRAWLAML
ncbi:phytoene synthase [Nannizzia gypsea CBS 118893]|uniref:Bifunctional lycopene cyclase/phytoene synthase n=1 Tax=Arthroderma gypseum (strain ATCC MYA-4604 / CBS 118893) TaxID=535722 RepID=LCPS_ARTGP|nr:phytoene synthase [Nannizzia gypsea CBS 118893]E4UPP6.1 RecName: Full=Bifunctional lycopene cyclase/phytoene synthase; Includes: RecName: Full=Lycopene beta-cyclase; AltName: Full=Lycopene cyclase; Includes: RecName: Full=Phytoene synthase [Nannizzia gypsea CBS 118893]EFQ99083.1 phytoene synthase [Nannizzia gypsea CBS 118893]